jgi:DNA-binding transcriptional ArsR family regulator
MNDEDAPDAIREIADLDRTIHEPSRLMIVAILSAVDGADFLYLQRATGLTAGNLSSHLARLEESGYVRVQKTFQGRVPHTACSLTDVGRQAFAAYRARLERALGGAG